jgi:serine/threonine-protein kinase
MSVLSEDRWRAVRPLLDRAMELGENEREAWIADLRRSDPNVAEDLESLLASRDELSREGFLENPPPRPAVPASLAGQTVGAYTLMEPIGQGGMGSVWLARRSDGRFEGRVAVKLLNASLVGRAGEARFRREGSILARLTHPHVARLLDAGVSASGQPYIVLEHVDGESVDEYADARKLPVDARLGLFRDVCAAVAQAHANLIVHRDIKPSNVLVGKDGQVKLLDFGIAKLLEEGSGGGGSTALTRESGRALTPDYAAPEQLTGDAVTTATDVHALGTLLYLLLTGQHPLGPLRSKPALLIEAIVETVPKRPSEVATAKDAENRSTTPDGLRRQLRGDLDTIVMKALKKSPGERYLSVEALSADIRRYLGHQPIGARPDTFGYRAAKFIRRHRAGVAAGALAAATVVVGTAAILWQVREARRQRDDARTALSRATATNEFLGLLLSAAAPPGRKFVVSDLLEQGETLADRQFAGDDALRAELLANLGRRYSETDRWERAVPVLERASRIAARTNDPGVRATVDCPLALTYVATQKATQGEALMAEALARLPAESRYALPRADCLVVQSSMGYFTDDGAAMIRHAREALAAIERAPIRSQLMRSDAQAALAYGYYLTRQNAKADRSYAELMAFLEKTGRGRTLAAADLLNNWGLVHYLGDIRKAEPLQRRSLELHRAIEGADALGPVPLHNYAGILDQLARYPEAEAAYRETILRARERNYPRIEIDATLRLACLYAEQGRMAEAAAAFGGVERREGEEVFKVKSRRALLAYSRGILARARRDFAEARSRFAEAVRLYDEIEAKYSVSLLARTELARAELATGHLEEAEAAARRALALAESLVEKSSPSYLIGLSQTVLGEIRLARRQPDAEVILREARAELEQTLGEEHPATFRARTLLKRAEAGKSRDPAAAPRTSPAASSGFRRAA